MTGVKALFEILAMLNYDQVNECDKRDLLRTVMHDLGRLKKINLVLERIEKRLEELSCTYQDNEEDCATYNELKYWYEELRGEIKQK